mgnify:CR=1 FL=1
MLKAFVASIDQRDEQKDIDKIHSSKVGTKKILPIGQDLNFSTVNC